MAATPAADDYNPALEEEDGDRITAEKVRTWFRDAYRSQQTYRDTVIENLQMLSGDQWPDDLKAKLESEGMAPIVINRMLMPLLFLSGVQRQTRQEPKLLPFEGGDLAATETMNTLLHWVCEQNRLDAVDSSVFVDKLGVGLGWWKVTMDFRGRDLEGDIRIRRRHPLAVFADPNWLEAGWEECQYVIDTLWLTQEEAAARWPEYASSFRRAPGEWDRGGRGGSGGGLGELAGDSLASERMFWDPATKRIRVLECWYKWTEETTVVYNAQTNETEDDPEVVARLQEAAPLMDPALLDQLVFVPRDTTRICVAHAFVDELLDDDDSPYETPDPTFPIFPALGYFFWKQPFGLADLMRDLQREKNKRRSKLIELVGRMPLSGFFNKTAGGADTKQIEAYASGNGVVINYETEIPQQIRPPDLPMALVRLEDKADEEIRDVPNVHDELLGQATQKTISGRAIEARQRGGLVSHETTFDSFRLEKQAVIKFVISLIQQYVSPAKALRILGTMAQRGAASPAGPQAQAPGGPGAPQDVLTALTQAYSTEYDVVISARPSEPSLAMQAWESLSEMAQNGAPIPPQVLFEAAAAAGILTEGQVGEIMAYIQQQQQAAAAQAQGAPAAGAPAQGPPPAPPAGPPPPPGPVG